MFWLSYAVQCLWLQHLYHWLAFHIIHHQCPFEDAFVLSSLTLILNFISILCVYFLFFRMTLLRYSKLCLLVCWVISRCTAIICQTTCAVWPLMPSYSYEEGFFFHIQLMDNAYHLCSSNSSERERFSGEEERGGHFMFKIKHHISLTATWLWNVFPIIYFSSQTKFWGKDRQNSALEIFLFQTQKKKKRLFCLLKNRKTLKIY